MTSRRSAVTNLPPAVPADPPWSHSLTLWPPRPSLKWTAARWGHRALVHFQALHPQSPCLLLGCLWVPPGEWAWGLCSSKAQPPSAVPPATSCLTCCPPPADIPPLSLRACLRPVHGSAQRLAISPAPVREGVQAQASGLGSWPASLLEVPLGSVTLQPGLQFFGHLPVFPVRYQTRSCHLLSRLLTARAQGSARPDGTPSPSTTVPVWENSLCWACPC